MYVVLITVTMQQAKGLVSNEVCAPKRKSVASVSSEVPHKKGQLVNPAEKWHCIANRFLSDEENSDDDPARKMVAYQMARVSLSGLLCLLIFLLTFCR